VSDAARRRTECWNQRPSNDRQRSNPVSGKAPSLRSKSESSSKFRDEIRRAMHRHRGGVDSTGRQRQNDRRRNSQVASNINIFSAASALLTHSKLDPVRSRHSRLCRRQNSAVAPIKKWLKGADKMKKSTTKDFVICFAF